jgi:hypothetical protein
MRGADLALPSVLATVRHLPALSTEPYTSGRGYTKRPKD